MTPEQPTIVSPDPDQAAAPIAETAVLPAGMMNGFCEPAELRTLFAGFGLEYPEGLAFPWQHRWPQDAGPSEPGSTRRHTAVRVLRIEAIGEYVDAGVVSHRHYWHAWEEQLG